MDQSTGVAGAVSAAVGLPHTYRVGEIYNAALPQLPDAGAQLRMSEDGVELVVFLSDPTASEVVSFRTGEATFALLAGDHALIMGYRFGDMPWSDLPWQACRQRDLTAGLAPAGEDEQLQLLGVLVDSRTGRISALRLATWSPAFADAVREAILRQLRHGGAYADYKGGSEIGDWYRRYPSTQSLVLAADITDR